MNAVILTGRLVKDPVSRTSANGTEVAKFTVAVPKAYRNKDGVDADFIDVTSFGGQAKVVNEYMRKGTMVHVLGEINNNNYTDKDGVKRYTYDIIGSVVEFGESKSDQAEFFKQLERKYAN